MNPVDISSGPPQSTLERTESLSHLRMFVAERLHLQGKRDSRPQHTICSSPQRSEFSPPLTKCMEEEDHTEYMVGPQRSQFSHPAIPKNPILGLYLIFQANLADV